MDDYTKNKKANISIEESKENPPMRRTCATMDMHNKLLEESEEYRKERENIENMTEEYIKNKNK